MCAVDLQCHRRHKRTDVTCAGLAAPAGKRLLQELANLGIRIREVAGGRVHYSELSDFFYVWLRLALRDKYPDYFAAEFTPKSLEAVANRAREPEDPDGFYQRLLTQCWREAHRVLKPSGILTFTFHHSEDEPWVAVLESLFDAGFYLEATYPIVCWPT